MNKKISIILFFLIFTFFLIYCEKSFDPALDSTFHVKVDSVSVPNTIALNDTIVCKFWGILGSNGCYQFWHFRALHDSNRITISVWGYILKADICTCVMSQLNGKEYRMKPDLKGYYRIHILQPDNTVMKDSVLVL